MKNYFVLLILAAGLLNAQNKRFTYEYTYLIDSTNKADIQKELVVLDVNAAGSKFYSYEKFKSDSLLIVEIEKPQYTGSEFIKYSPSYKGKITYTISKIYPTYETFLHIGLGTDEYKVLDERKTVWKINAEKQKIGEFHAQKAETEMFGRKWTAWFATEIPIQDGPYKFHGLPGLIIKIEDFTKTHSFELMGISKNLDSAGSTDQKKLFNSQEIAVNYTQYKKMYLELQNDPTKSLREMMNQSGSNLRMVSSDGSEVKPADLIRKRELEAQEARKKNNNPLELDLQIPDAK
ncbi:MAG: GLPGLI family protein [Flavobacteriia bacterium]|nr:GLPGLI family protein [Flavobacteriia bacterium]MBH2023063.1 GLPGLI family protein [Flavobacteriales bacterium]